MEIGTIVPPPHELRFVCVGAREFEISTKIPFDNYCYELVFVCPPVP